MTIELWPIDKPIPYARNARVISEAAVTKVAASIKEFGFRQPIVVDCEGVIVVGHTRLLAAQKLGLITVPVHVAASLSGAQVRAYRLMDNRSHEEAEWDLKLLPLELEDLKTLDQTHCSHSERSAAASWSRKRIRRAHRRNLKSPHN